MNRALLLICAVLLLAGVIAGCGYSESCPAHERIYNGTCVCVYGYERVDGKCAPVQNSDGDTSDGDTTEGDTTDGDTADDDTGEGVEDGESIADGDTTDGDTTDGDTTDGDTADDDTAEGVEDGESIADGDTTDGDTTDGDTTDGDTADDDTADGVEDEESIADGDTMDGEYDLAWVSIPGGSFMMGCLPGDSDCRDNESPRHTVTMSAFEITATVITQGQYEVVTGTSPSFYNNCGDNCPVHSLDWYEAKAFCEAVGGRLPSEAEWEYVARAGTATIYSCGDDASCLDGIAWYVSNSNGGPHSVAGKDANAFGLYDMLGNVWEWVEDCYHEDYIGAPSTGGVWSDGVCSYLVVFRGGFWDSHSITLRVSARSGGNPSTRYSSVGFRCARDVQ